MRDENMKSPEIRALALLGEQFELAIARVDAAESAAALPRRARTWPRLLPQRRLARTAVAAALACAIGLLAYSLSLDTGRSPSPETALADVAAVARLASLPADDQYTYTRALTLERFQPVGSHQNGETQTTPDSPMLITSERRAWISIDRPGLVINEVLSVRAADPDVVENDDLRKRALGSVTKFEHPRLRVYKFGQRSYSRAEIAQLSTEPAAIVERLSADLNTEAGDERAFELWKSITETLTYATAPLPPELRAGLIDALALVPGVHTLGDEITVGVRDGIGFAMESMGVEQTIVFDGETADVLLAESKIVTREAARNFEQPVGSLISRYELLETSIVDQINEGPISEE